MTSSLSRGLPRFSALRRHHDGSPLAEVFGTSSEPLVVVRDLKKHFRLPGGWLAGRQYVYAVDGITFDVARGEVLGLVGESGCGKMTLGRSFYVSLMLRRAPSSLTAVH